jgi:glycosyltransferase involved in cell wall biosynthesis
VGLISWSSKLANEPMLRRADVVYTVGFKTHVAAGLTHHRPLVWHLHEFPPDQTGGIWRFLARHVPDALIANSVAVHRSWSRGHEDRSSHIVLNGVDLHRFKPRKPTGWIHRALSLPDNARLVGMPAVLVRWKGQFEVIAAFRQIQERFPDAHLVLVGGAIYETAGGAAIETELRSSLEGSTRIHILPFQEDVERVYPEFTLTVHYSLRPEPFGRVIVESLSCGVPVAAAAEGGPLEILQADNGDGAFRRARQGWLVQPRTPSALAQALESALCLPAEDIEAIGRAGRERAERAFSAETFARGVADVLWSVKRAL